ncbi:MAG TPA: F0F1 ATP synthase subunit B [Flavobacteriales bacterium]|nr:F0F1 ATP synthase subunit B [Flavobacteriales bacterium]
MGLVTPGLGLIIWTTIAFLTVLFLLKKFAWKPIMTAIKNREESIENALKASEKAMAEMENIKSNAEKEAKKAREERDAILKEARDLKEAIVGEAKTKATAEADRIINAARETIKNEKLAAISELKNQVATLSIEIAEKMLKSELSAENKQNTVINSLVDDINLN